MPQKTENGIRMMAKFDSFCKQLIRKNTEANHLPTVVYKVLQNTVFLLLSQTFFRLCGIKQPAKTVSSSSESLLKRGGYYTFSRAVLEHVLRFLLALFVGVHLCYDARNTRYFSSMQSD